MFFNKFYGNSVTPHNAEKVVFNFSTHVLTDHEKSLLSKGLNFAIPAKGINYADYLLQFELMYKDINSLRTSIFDFDCTMTRLRGYKETSKFMESNLPKAEFDAFKSLIRNK